MKEDQVLMEKEDNIVDFKTEKAKLLLPMHGGTEPPRENWLSHLNKGTIFLARRKNEKALNLDKYLLIQHKGVATELYFITPDGKQLTLWVLSLEFSRAVDLHQILAEVEFEEAPLEEKTTDDKGTILSGRLADDEDA